MRRAPHPSSRPHYTAVGHVTIDVLADGSRRLGGSAFYAALQAARLGLRARILTRGRAREIEPLIAPFSGELDLDVQAAEHTTTLLTSAPRGGLRKQRVLAWAGAIDCAERQLDTQILHLAPVARETPARPRGRWQLLGLTAQGLVRHWEQGLSAAPIRLGAPDPDQVKLAARCDALVLSEAEREACAPLIEAARAGDAAVVITAAGASKTLLEPGGRELRLRPVPVAALRDDIGAGDVFAAAFFVSLAERRSVLEAARFASAAAALRLEGDGAGAIATRAQIERRLDASPAPAR